MDTTSPVSRAEREEGIQGLGKHASVIHTLAFSWLQDILIQ